MGQYYVYIMASHRGTLYVGVTSDLFRRVYEHRYKLADGFTKKYKVSNLVYYEVTEDVSAAIVREKQIKGWNRNKKAALIESMNLYWADLAKEWYENSATPDSSSRQVGTQNDTETNKAIS